MGLLATTPVFSAERVWEILEQLYGVRGRCVALPSERDQNFRVDVDGMPRYVLKIANAAEEPEFLAAQNGVLAHVAGVAGASELCPRVVETRDGKPTATVHGAEDRTHFVRMVSFLEGKPLGTLDTVPDRLHAELGQALGRLDRALSSFDHPAFHRTFHWDLAQGADVVRRWCQLIPDAGVRSQVDRLVGEFERHTRPRLDSLRRSVIHNDANDHNVIVRDIDGDPRIAGLIDFGDMVYSYTVGDLAIGIAYAILDCAEPLDVAATMTRGYHAEHPLSREEIDALYGLVCLRLCASACIAADQLRQRPDDPYLAISQEPIRRSLPRLVERPFPLARSVLREACGMRSAAGEPRTTDRRGSDRVLAQRRARLGGNLSLGYSNPVHLARGWMQYLYDRDGRRYLDGYNNVPHVGHAHPRVAEAAYRQMTRLSTNTRYLYGALGDYAGRLAATLPDPLSVCYFVNSASEANELALRLARVATGGREMIVLGAAYHGHTTSLIDLSPYKHDGPGGSGAPDWVRVAPVPDLYRGPFREDVPDAATCYADHVGQLAADVTNAGGKLAGMIAETCPSVGGQLFFPAGYLAQAYRHIRDAGGLCIADEVQTGYGRIGTAFYAFEEHGVIPDIVVLGKPIGNGHPIGAVVTTPAIAAAFDNGMEFFSTFGGNTVSCEIGLTVLDIVQQEGLQQHAMEVGRRLLEGLRQLMGVHPAIGDVRGSGLFLGAELVENRDTREPAAVRASRVCDLMREDGVLIGTDGPDHNVLKIRPPMPFDRADAEYLLETLDSALRRAGGP